MNKCIKHEACGCEASTCCLECPLLVCKYDDPVKFHAEKKADKKTLIWNRLQEGATIDSLTHTFGLSKRQIDRLLKEMKDEVSA